MPSTPTYRPPGRPRIRLFVDQPLGAGKVAELSRDHAHYLSAVMRKGPGEVVALFNGQDGEWRAEIADLGKRSGHVLCQAQTAPQRDPPDLWLLFAPLKKARTDFVVEKAVELGVKWIQPVMTEYTNAERIRRDRLQAHAIEAAEQCGGTFVPQIAELAPLDQVVSAWPDNRRLMLCDEAAAEQPLGLDPSEAGPWAILIGPEGGFSERDRRVIAQINPRVVSLGPRILRADTAAVAAITLWQFNLGDWSPVAS